VAEPREVQRLPPASASLIEISLNQSFLSPKRRGPVSRSDVNISNHEQEQNSAP
jgi:hypothetical protein